MTSFPDPEQDGGYRFRAVNNHGKILEVGIDPGPNPASFIQLPPPLTSPLEVRNYLGQVLTTLNGGANAPTAQTVINTGPGGITVPFDVTKTAFAGVTVGGPIQVDLPDTSAIAYSLYILNVEPGQPIGGPALFPVTLNPFGAQIINALPGPRLLPDNFVMCWLWGVGNGSWGAWTLPPLP